LLQFFSFLGDVLIPDLVKAFVGRAHRIDAALPGFRVVSGDPQAVAAVHSAHENIQRRLMQIKANDRTFGSKGCGRRAALVGVR
jgi:hypothetical protein